MVRRDDAAPRAETNGQRAAPGPGTVFVLGQSHVPALWPRVEALRAAGVAVQVLWVEGPPPDDSVICLPETPVRYLTGLPAARSHRVYQYLLTADYQTVFFPSSGGYAYYSLVCQSQNAGFRDTSLCIGFEGPLEAELETRLETYTAGLDRRFLERASAGLARRAWTTDRGRIDALAAARWRLPAVLDRLPPLTPQSPIASDPGGAAGPPSHLVFFGLSRDGAEKIRAVLEALAGAGRALPPVWVVTERGSVEASLLETCDTWPGRPRCIAPEDTASLLEQERCLWVLPADHPVVDPLVVAVIARGRRLLAADRGGIRELVATELQSALLVDPAPAALRAALLRALDDGGTPSRPASSANLAAERWATWASTPRETTRSAPIHGAPAPLVSVCIAHRERPALLRQALDSLSQQDYSNFEVVIVDDGSASQSALSLLDTLTDRLPGRGGRVVRQERSYPGAARNHAARLAKGDFFLFMDDDNYACPHELSTLVAAALHTGADVLTCPADLFVGDQAPNSVTPRIGRWLPLGPASAPSLFHNRIGDTNALFRRSAFEALGGFTEDFGVGYEDYELLVHATLRGMDVQVVPEVLFWRRENADGVNRHTGRTLNLLRILRPYLHFLPESITDTLRLAQGQHELLQPLALDQARPEGPLARAIRRWLPARLRRSLRKRLLLAYRHLSD